MTETNDLQYTNEAEATRYLFYKDSQDVNFFVEDKNKEYEYEILFEQLFPNLKIKSIFATGGKPAMEKLFYEFGDKDNQFNPNIYIADGDFDKIIHYERMIKHSNFIYLDAYNIESFLFDEKLCVKISMMKLEKCFKDTQKKIKFDEWYTKIIDQAKELFFIYCYLQAFHPNIKSVGNSPYIFIDPKTGFEKQGAFNDYKNNLLINNGIDIIQDDAKIEEIKKKYYLIYGDDFWHLICGKFILTSLVHYLKSKGVSTSEGELKRFFIINCNIKNFNSLVSNINNIIDDTKSQIS